LRKYFRPLSRYYAAERATEVNCPIQRFIRLKKLSQLRPIFDNVLNVNDHGNWLLLNFTPVPFKGAVTVVSLSDEEVPQLQI
jgi:hypothetical protein